MHTKLYLPLLLFCLLLSCKTSKDNSTSNSAPERPVRGDLKFTEDPKYQKEVIAKGACRVRGVVDYSSQAASPIVIVTEFLGEGANFITYKPLKGDKIEVKGLEKHNYKTGDTLSIEIQTTSEKIKQIQKVGLIKILDL